MLHREVCAALLALGQMLAGFVDGPAALLAAFLELPHAGLKVPRPFLALGQLDLDLGRLAAGGHAKPLQPIDLLAQLHQLRLHLAQAGVELFAVLLGVGQAAQGGRVLIGGAVQFGFQRRPLLVELGSPLLGGGDRHAVLGQGVERLLAFRGSPVELLLLGGDLFGQLGDGLLGRVDGGLRLAELGLEGPQLAPPRDQAGRGVARSHHQRAVGLQQLAGKGHEAEAAADGTSQFDGLGKLLDEPRAAQQPPGQREKAGLRLDEPVAPTEHARPSFEIGHFGRHSRQKRVRMMVADK